MVAVIALGVYAGIKLDDYFQVDKPIFTALVSLASVILAIYLAMRDFIKK